MSEQTSEDTALLPRPTDNDREAWLTYWNALGQPWRTEPEINEKRKAYLAGCLTIKPDIKQGLYPFKEIKLSRADVEWLLVMHENECGPVDWKDETQHKRKGLDLRGADLRQVNMSGLPLAGMLGSLTANEWHTVTREQYNMARVHLEKAHLSTIHLEGASLYGAYLDRANLSQAHLEEANLGWAHLEHSILRMAHLEAADLRGTYFDAATNLEKIILGDERRGFIFLADLHWDGVNLSVVNWTQMKTLGDEREARQRKTHDGRVKHKAERLGEYESAVRANRQLAAVLHAQGMNEVAAGFTYRANLLQKWILWQQRKFGQYLFSLFLDLLAGYGYKPMRSLIAYLLVIVGFAIAYYEFGHLPLLPDAFVFSLTSFHGRGFLPGLENKASLHNPLVVLAALEAVIGLFIEISFIATFTQRFFGK